MKFSTVALTTLVAMAVIVPAKAATNQAPPGRKSAPSMPTSPKSPTSPTPPPKPKYIEPQISQAQRDALTAELRAKRLLIPVAGVSPESLKGSFFQGRGTDRMHKAVDFVAARNTPIMAVENGRIARLFNSKAGGITIYQTDPSKRFVFYYAHLESYAPGLAEGQELKRGQVIGYVGTSGNAPPDSPHLHFAIWQTTPDRVFNGIAIDPYDVFRNSPPSAAPKQRPRGGSKNSPGAWI